MVMAIIGELDRNYLSSKGKVRSAKLALGIR